MREDSELPAADALFAWDFYANPFPEAFLWNFASYFNPTYKGPVIGEQCLELIRQGIKERGLRRVVLILDGLETLQRSLTDRTSVGELLFPFMSELLRSVSRGEVPLFVIITSRLEPVELLGHRGVEFIQVGALEPDSACAMLRACEVNGDDARLATIADRFALHALTIYHLGRLIGDFYNGDAAATDKLPIVERQFQHTGVKEVDDINRRFIELFAHYEEVLSAPERGVLERVAALGRPISISEFREIFLKPDLTDLAGPLALLTPGGFEDQFASLHARHLLTIYTEPGQPPRYFTHPMLSDYFADAFTADYESFNQGAIEYLKRQLLPGQASNEASKSSIRTRGVVRIRRELRTRGVTSGPDDPKAGYATEERTLDLLEQIILHTVRAGHIQEARFFYEKRMGGDEHLEEINQQHRARRINALLEGRGLR
jgi:hypothetical protein